MLRKDVKALFKAIRNRDNEAAQLLLSDKPELALSTAKAPPKKDDGQSPLQVAFKTGNFEAVALLLDCGADVNFHETSSVNEWTAPVVHDAIRAAFFSHESDTAIMLLQRMFELGADPNAADSYGNAPLHRALLDARIEVRSSPGFPERIDDPARKSRVERVFSLLLGFGANPDQVASRGETPAETFADEPALVSLLKVRPGLPAPDPVPESKRKPWWRFW